MLLARDGEPLGAVGRTGVTQDATKNTGQEVGQEFLIPKIVGPVGIENVGPLSQGRSAAFDGRQQDQCLRVGTENVEAEERFDFAGQCSTP